MSGHAETVRRRMALLKVEVDRRAYLFGLATATLFLAVVVVVVLAVHPMAGAILGVAGLLASVIPGFVVFRDEPPAITASKTRGHR